MSYRIVILTADKSEEGIKPMMKIFENSVKKASSIKLASKYFFNNIPNIHNYKEIATVLFKTIEEIQDDILDDDEFILNIGIEPEYLSAIIMICKVTEYNRNSDKFVIGEEIKPSGTMIKTLRNIFKS